MRDIDRIDPFMEEMGSLWKEKFPDWRFGQLMYNFFSALGDPFYYEEDELMAAFKAYCERQNPKEAVKKLREEKRKDSPKQMSKEDLEEFYKEVIRKSLISDKK